MDYHALKNRTVVELRALGQEMGLILPAKIAKAELINRLLKACEISAPSGNEGVQKDTKKEAEAVFGEAAVLAEVRPRRGRPPKARIAENEKTSAAAETKPELPKMDTAAPKRPRTTRRDEHIAERSAENRSEANGSEAKPVRQTGNFGERSAENRSEASGSEAKPVRQTVNFGERSVEIPNEAGASEPQTAQREDASAANGDLNRRPAHMVSPRQGLVRPSAASARPRMEAQIDRRADAVRKPATFVRRVEDGQDRRSTDRRRTYPADNRRAEGVLARGSTEIGEVRRTDARPNAENGYSRRNYEDARSNYTENGGTRPNAENGYSRRNYEEARSNYTENSGTRTNAENGYSRRNYEDARSNYAENGGTRPNAENGYSRRNYEDARSNYTENGGMRPNAENGYSRRNYEDARPNYADNRSAEEAYNRRANYEFTAEGVPIGDFSDGAGMLELQQDGSFGMLRAENCQPGSRDIYISIAQVRRFNLRPGDWIEGKVRPPREGDRYGAMIYITKINGEAPDRAAVRKNFDALVPLYPEERLRLESKVSSALALRMIDMLAPIGKGQRGMIVSPPKAGKTTLLKQIANAIAENNPEVELIVLLIDERPEEVTDMKRSIRGEVIYSTFDEAPENHTRVSEMVLEHAQRMVEMGKDVVILMDSITRLARAYNLVIQPTGRSLSGGLDPGALYKPKRFFGAARNIENGGSLTIIATALVDTGSRMDDIIYEEFKGTGNMELHLDRKLSEKRIFPAVDMVRSGTRREELLLSREEMDGAMQARRMLGNGSNQQNAEQLIGLLEKTATNAEFFKKLKGWVSAYEKDGFSLGGK